MQKLLKKRPEIIGKKGINKEKKIRSDGMKKNQTLGGGRDEVAERPSAAHPEEERSQPVKKETFQIPLQTRLTSPGGHLL